jgi:hypothetical protein
VGVAWVVACFGRGGENVRSELCRYAHCWISGKLVSIDALVEVKISSTLLKPAALLLLGASTVFGCSVANALTFNWRFTASGGYDLDTSTDLTGTVVEGTIDNLVDNALNTTGMTATFTSGFNVGRTLAYTSGTGIRVT